MAGNFDAKTDPLAPTHPIAPKFFLVVDKKILNTGCGADEYAWLLRTGRALDARAEARIKSADVHDETEAQRLFLGVALGDAQMSATLQLRHARPRVGQAANICLALLHRPS